MNFKTIYAIFFFLVLAVFTWNIATAQTQKIAIKGVDITLLQAFGQLEAQTRYTVAYDKTKVNVGKTVSVDINSANINSVLNEILKNSDVAYRISGNHIFVYPKPAEAARPTPAPAVVAKEEPVAAPEPAAVPEPEPEIVPEPEPEPLPVAEIPKRKNVKMTRGERYRYGYYAPDFAFKSNLLYDATTTMNLGMEFRMGKKMTMEIPVSYNPWTFSEGRQLKLLLIQPELRYWLCEPFGGHFFGLHAHWAMFNVGGIEQLNMKDARYQGDLYGAGISYGYQWMLGGRWSMEATVGVGYARLIYDKYQCKKCGTSLGHYEKDYWGPTKVGLSLIYFIK